VLRTRPGSAPPQICLPSTLSDTGHTCTSTHAFASGFLQACITATTLAFGYPSPPSGWVWTLPDICVINIDHHHLAAGPCPAHIGIGRSLTAPPSHTTVRTGPYTAVRLIRQNQIQGNKRPSDVK